MNLRFSRCDCDAGGGYRRPLAEWARQNPILCVSAVMSPWMPAQAWITAFMAEWDRIARIPLGARAPLVSGDAENLTEPLQVNHK